MVKKVVVEDRSLTNLFPEITYDKSELSFPILDIWNNIRLFTFPKDKERSIFSYYRVQSNDTLYSISNNFYKTIDYWWLTPLVNDVEDPFTFLDDVRNDSFGDNNRVIKILKNKYISKINSSMIIFKNRMEEINRKESLTRE